MRIHSGTNFPCFSHLELTVFNKSFKRLVPFFKVIIVPDAHGGPDGNRIRAWRVCNPPRFYFATGPVYKI